MDACRCPLRCIVPPGLLLRIIRDRTRAEGPWTAALETLAIDQTFRHRRAESAARMAFAAPRPAVPRISAGKPHRMIYDQGHSFAETLGTLVRAEGQRAVADGAANDAYDGFGATYRFYWDILRRDSIDDRGMAIVGLV